MDHDALYGQFETWIDAGLVDYGPHVGRTKAFHAMGEAAEIIARDTPLHIIGNARGRPVTLLLTHELIDLFGAARVQSLCARAQGHGNDNEVGWER